MENGATASEREIKIQVQPLLLLPTASEIPGSCDFCRWPTEPDFIAVGSLWKSPGNVMQLKSFLVLSAVTDGSVLGFS